MCVTPVSVAADTSTLRNTACEDFGIRTHTEMRGPRRRKAHDGGQSLQSQRRT